MKGFFKAQEEDVNPLQQRYPKKKKLEVFSPRVSSKDYEEPERLPETPCQCKMSGSSNGIFCDRHQCIKTKSLHHLCQTRMDYYKMWEDGNGPMQDPITKSLSRNQNKRNDLNDGNENVIVETPKDGNKGFFMGDPDIPIESRGLGDTLAKITKATGIKKVVDTVFDAINKDCGCKERQSKLNKVFPYKKQESPKRKTKGFFE